MTIPMSSTEIDLDTTHQPEPTPSKWWHTAAACVATGIAVIALFGLIEREEPEVVAPGSTYTTNQDVEYLEFAGTVRNEDGTWKVLNNSGHADDDLISVTNVTTTSIRVNYPACSQIVSVIVGADNEYAQDFGAQFGISAGLTFGVIEGSINDSSDTGTSDDIWDPTTDYTAGTNIWIMGKCLPA